MMEHSAARRQGDEVRVGYTIGRVPLGIRGIRFADGDGGEGGGAPPVPTPPAPAPTPPPVQVVTAPERPAQDWYHPDYVKGLRDEAKGHRERAEATTAEVAAERTAREAAEARVAEFEAREAERARTDALTAASQDLADPAALLDSQAFAQAIDGVDAADADALRAKIAEFVDANPRFKVGAPSNLPPRQQAAPAGGGAPPAGPTSLGSAISAHYATR